MQSFAEIVRALASLAWPVLAGFLLYKFFPLIKAFLSRDKVTLKIGEMEISAEQAAQSLTDQVKDLQEKIVQIEQKMPDGGTIPHSAESKQLKHPVRRGEKQRILWVDDVPTNNAIQIQKLMNDGMWVDTATTTTQAISMFEFTKYDLVITDMGRTEDGIKRPNAGIILAKEIRQRDRSIPIIVFTTHQALSRFQDSAEKAGINFITNSTVDLYRQISVLLIGK